MARPSVLVALAPGFEETEAVAPADVLSRAGVRPILASVGGRLWVTGSHRLSVKTQGALPVRTSPLAGVFLPGGMPGTLNLMRSARLKAVVHHMWEAGKPIAAICASPMVLAEMGLLQGRRVTSHPSVRERLGGVNYEELPVVVDPPFITSRGPGTALWCGLTMVACLKGPQVALDLASAMVITVPHEVVGEWSRWPTR